MAIKKKLTAIDLFCGSGAVSLGLKSAGFDVVGAVDYAPMACATYRLNHPEVKLVESDISTLSPEVFDDVVNEGLDLLVVCAPCQPFSTQNRRKSNLDPRRDLVSESLKFIDRFSPKIVFLENVPGLASTDIFANYADELIGRGYAVSTPTKLDAARLGVAQRRYRMVLIATREANLVENITFPDCPSRTVRDLIADLPIPPIGKPVEPTDSLHFARRHSELNLQRLSHIPKDGGSRSSLPLELQLKCHKNKKPTSFSDVYGRMRWDDVAPTLTTGCTDITRGRFAHPEQNRGITLREAARLQSFPDSYVFVGNSAHIATQIGNAVPPVMMKNIAKTMVRVLTSM
ncbi:DNA cytosine methyltransferase [Shewanella chilikensis]|jgi:DNA (cytosine-5)-methyltransferase 1|uniref:DNA cytosine methyltransferase n=1 Tax=Shewanella chilikensis TaxID=558541 RepID=UPI0039997D48